MPQAPMFWSWQGIVALCTALIVAGKLTDTLIRKGRREKMLAALAELEHRIAALPLRTYQRWMVAAFIEFFHCLSTPSVLKAVRRYRPSLMLPISWATGVPGVGRAVVVTLGRIVWTALSLLVVVAALCFDHWLLHSLAVYALVYLLSVGLVSLWAAYTLHRLVQAFPRVEAMAAEIKPDPVASKPIVVWYLSVQQFNIGDPKNFCHFVTLFSPGSRALMVAAAAANHPLVLSLTVVARALLLSVLATIVALWLGTHMALPQMDYAWFSRGLDGVRPQAVFWLTLISAVFDLATLMITIRLLGWFVKRRRSMTVVAALDILTSLALSLGLLWVLMLLAGIDQFGWVKAAAYAWQHLGMLWPWQVSAEQPFWALLPVALNTTLPMVAYLIVPFLIGVVLKPLAAIAAYLSGWAGEQKYTPFLGLSAALATVLALTKVFMQWPWFMAWVNGGSV